MPLGIQWAGSCKVRILHVIRGLANSSGTTHVVGPLAEAQAQLGHEVEVLFVSKPGEPSVVPDPGLVRSRECPMTVRSRQYGWSRSFARAMREAVRRVDVVHIHAIWNYPTWCAMREAHRAGIPYVVAPQGSLEDWALGRRRRVKRLYSAIAEKPYFDRAAAIQALTCAEARQCQQFGIRAPARILPNGVDRSVLSDTILPAGLRAELGLPAHALLYLFVGRLFPKKGLDQLIPAFSRLVAECPDAFLLIAGHDAGSGYRRELETLIQATRAAGHFWFLGEVRGMRKFHVLRGADVFVLPSYSEGLPVAVLEAMASRLPVIVTPGCHLPQVVEVQAGWSTEPAADQLLDGLREAARDAGERRRRGQLGQKLVEKYFTWDKIAAQSVDLYREMRTRPLSTVSSAM